MLFVFMKSMARASFASSFNSSAVSVAARYSSLLTPIIFMLSNMNKPRMVSVNCSSGIHVLGCLLFLTDGQR